MKIPKGGSGEFESCPEYTGPAVCVDVTPLKERMTNYGAKQQFRVVFEVAEKRKDGKPFCVWSKNFTPSSHEKAAVAQFMRGWLGRMMTDDEWASFDTEELIGKPANVIIINEEAEGKVYANIQVIRPHKQGPPLVASRTFVRAKDRTDKGQTYVRGGQAPAPGAGQQANPDDDGYGPAGEAGGGYNDVIPDWSRTKVHVGKHAGHELRELTVEAIRLLIEKWIPAAMAKGKLTADDQRLMEALTAFQQHQAQLALVNAAADAADDDVAF